MALKAHMRACADKCVLIAFTREGNGFAICFGPKLSLSVTGNDKIPIVATSHAQMQMYLDPFTKTSSI